MLTQVYAKLLENLNEEVTFLGMDNLFKFAPKGKEAVSGLILLLKAIGKLVKQLPTKTTSKPTILSQTQLNNYGKENPSDICIFTKHRRKKKKKNF